jgi:RNA polymerase subunit RPABC4/transcription elongation factor Spt4
MEEKIFCQRCNLLVAAAEFCSGCGGKLGLVGKSEPGLFYCLRCKRPTDGEESCMVCGRLR